MSLSPGKSDDFRSSEFQENLDILRQTYLFSALPLQSLKVFAYVCAREKFRAGDHLFVQDEDDGQAFFIIAGRAALECRSSHGATTIREYGEGDFLGGIALLGSFPRIFSLRALTEMVCLVLQRDKFVSALQQFPELTPKIVKAVVESVAAWEQRGLSDHVDQCELCKNNVGVSII